jgi:hypothetical protein
MAFDKPTVVDDDGSGTTGTILDAAFLDDFGDRIDAAIDGVDADVRPVALGGTGLSALGDPLEVLRVNAAGNALEYAAASGGASWVEQSTAVTGAQHNFDLNDHLTVLRCTGAAPVFSGFTVNGGAPAAGDQVLIVCLGTTAKVTNQDAGSTAAHRIITPSTNGQIVGLNGLMLLVYDDTTDRWREFLIESGAPIAVAFDAAHYTASGSMTLTVAAGDVIADVYIQRGTLVTFISTIQTATVGGTPSNELRKAFPAGFTAKAGEQWSPVVAGFDNNVGASFVISNQTSQSNAYLRIRRQDGANFAAATNTTYIYIPALTFEMN